jgi:TrwC relaxase
VFVRYTFGGQPRRGIHPRPDTDAALAGQWGMAPRPRRIPTPPRTSPVMLSIGKLGAGQERYYTERVAEGAEDYYSGRGEAEGYWLGSTAVDLGLDGKVDPEELTAMLTGRHPATGEPLGLRHVAGRGPVPGFDLTFSAPKSSRSPGRSAARAPGPRCPPPTAPPSPPRSTTCSARRAGPGAGTAAMNSSGATASSPPATSIAPPAPGIPSSTPTSWSPTRPVDLTAAGPGSTTRRSTTTRRPPATSTRRTCGGSWPAGSASAGRRWPTGSPRSRASIPTTSAPSRPGGRRSSPPPPPDASARARQVAALDTRRAKERDITAESLRERWRARAEEIGLDRETIRCSFDRGQEVGPARVAASDVADALTSRASHFDRHDAIQAVADRDRAQEERHQDHRGGDAPRRRSEGRGEDARTSYAVHDGRRTRPCSSRSSATVTALPKRSFRPGKPIEKLPVRRWVARL